MSELPTREAVREAWEPFEAKYDKYLAESNWDSWLMQDKIVHAYMTGRLIDRDTIDYEALRERVCRRIHAVGPASLSASQVTQLKLAMDDIRAALGGQDDSTD